jgi:ABC-2 type transport system permease protein
MRYLKIFLLHFEQIFEYRSRSFVWFIKAGISPLIMLTFWIGALKGSTTLPAEWTFSTITSYYFLLIIATALLTAHIEEVVAKEDIQEGKLVKYLLKPFSYFWVNFFIETPFRVLQGSMAIFESFLLVYFFKVNFAFSTDWSILFLSFIITILAYFLSFIFKMIVGLLAFWLIDIHGFYQLVDVTLLVFAGYILPINLLPGFLEKLSYILPFSYMIYFPITAFQGKFQIFQLFQIISVQIIWLLIFYFLYRMLWEKGLKKFTAVGQ